MYLDYFQGWIKTFKLLGGERLRRIIRACSNSSWGFERSLEGNIIREIGRS